MRGPLLLLAAAAALASACAPQTKYHWGDYDTAMYKFYQNPAGRDAWVESLRTIILQAEQLGDKVPPGICAEYGYALFEEGQAEASVKWFQREKETWPESTVLMDKMIRNATRRGAQPPPPGQGAAGAVEKRT